MTPFEWNCDLVGYVRDRATTNAAGVMGAYMLSVGIISSRSRMSGRRDLDFDLTEFNDQLTANELQDLVRLRLWQDLGQGRYRLLGLHRWVRIPALAIGKVRR